MTDAEKLAQLRALAEGHRFDYREMDTGVTKCQHYTHISGYDARCCKAWLGERLAELDKEDLS